MQVWHLAACELWLGKLCHEEMQKICLDVLLACGFGALMCVNCVRGSCANRRCENVVMSYWHVGLAPCCV